MSITTSYAATFVMAIVHVSNQNENKGEIDLETTLTKQILYLVLVQFVFVHDRHCRVLLLL